jgi:hypothetical protein
MILKIYFTKAGITKGGITIGLYLVFFTVAFLLGKQYPSGPCNPGLDVLLFLFLPVPIITLLLFHLVKAANGNRSDGIPVMIHLIVLILYTLFFLFSL